jgi:hypothetical protein
VQFVGLVGVGFATKLARAEKKYGPGASDSEIKIGQTQSVFGAGFSLRGAGATANRLLQDDQ